ncbi:conserved hypothetical protein [Treponema phagedenis]|uniref:Uncharacterized protein n=1 Tax=Treponema phagedenis TaxID=162 RepID=A0A0B7GX63_TREPH|nr:conserved hypothetical protein [Treponema phagedenis]
MEWTARFFHLMLDVKNEKIRPYEYGVAEYCIEGLFSPYF